MITSYIGNAENFDILGFMEKYLDFVEEKIAKYNSSECKAKWGNIVEDDSWLV